MFDQDFINWLVGIAAMGNVLFLFFNTRYSRTARLARTLHDLLRSAKLLAEDADEARLEAQRARRDAERLQRRVEDEQENLRRLIGISSVEEMNRRSHRS